MYNFEFSLNSVPIFNPAYFLWPREISKVNLYISS